MWAYLTTLTVIPYTLAYVRRTETTREEGVFGYPLMPWQLILIGTSVLFFLILSLVGHKKACTEISNRLTEKK
jgi:hypothetical protein